jgi:SAM-dependent methyltransferase
MTENSAAAAYYEQGGGKSPAAAMTILATLRSRVALGHTLDIGCGDGGILEALTIHAVAVTGIDASEEAVALSRARVGSAHILKADVQERLPFSDDSFDSVFMLDVIEHLEKPAAALREINRVLRVGGTLAITTPNANSPLRLFHGKKWFGLRDPHHLLFFTSFTLSHLLQKTGFDLFLKRVEPFTGTIADPIFRPLGIGGTLFFVAQKRLD